MSFFSKRKTEMEEFIQEIESSMVDDNTKIEETFEEVLINGNNTNRTKLLSDRGESKLSREGNNQDRSEWHC